ncbi:MAG TPA: hypothetical protein PKY59_10220 [Pyrinomonadaceae bacterium]|nr:hypothetical protein [Pyrinomonadaceae bacterium]
MLVKIYMSIWGLTAALAGILFLTGYFSKLTLVAFGFICFGLIFMGFMSVLPTTVGHNLNSKH